MRHGRDVVAVAPPALAGSLPLGTLLDDYLTPESRVAIESDARRRTRAWLDARACDLVVDGIDLGWVWEIELYSEAVLPALRFVTGTWLAASALGGPVECPETDAFEAAALAETGLDVCGGEGAGALSLPRTVVRLPLHRRLALRAQVPVPQRVRGSVRVVDHWALAPLVRAFATDGRLVPVLDPGLLHGLPLPELARLALHGGWLGVPGPRRRSRSARVVSARLEQLAPAGGTALERLIDRRARALLAERSPLTPALVDRQRRAFVGRRIRLVVVPFDSIAATRSVLVAAREHGIPSLLVQHGYAGEPNDPDRRESDHVAIWSEHVSHGARPATVTGNPAAPAARAARRPVAMTGRTLLLVQPPSVLSVRWDARVSRSSVEIGLAGIAAARPGSDVVLRPHPHDPDPEAHATAVRGLRVVVDRSSSIDDLFATCDLCVGGVSTATLQAGVAGLPVVFLDVSQTPTQWPFDGTSDVPTARDAGALSRAIQRALAAPDVLGGDALAEALGVRAGALDALVQLALTLAERAR